MKRKIKVQYRKISDKQIFYNHKFIQTRGEFNDFLDILRSPSKGIWRGLDNALFANYTSLQRHTLIKKDLNSYDVKIESALYTETLNIHNNDKNSTNTNNSGIKKELSMGLVSTDDKKMTDMIKYLTKAYEGRFHFSINEISYEEKTKLYFSELKVSLL